MQGERRTGRLTTRLVDQLYIEAMVLADEVRTYFDETGRHERDLLPAPRRVTFSCESLKITTRLMHVIAWLLTRRAVEAGEISVAQAREPMRRLGSAAGSETPALVGLPETARRLIGSSLDLYARVERLDQDIDSPAVAPSPARSLLRRLEQAF